MKFIEDIVHRYKMRKDKQAERERRGKQRAIKLLDKVWKSIDQTEYTIYRDILRSRSMTVKISRDVDNGILVEFFYDSKQNSVDRFCIDPMCDGQVMGVGYKNTFDNVFDIEQHIRGQIEIRIVRFLN
jgi:hypothetical protein